jgi:hypothetical protein
MRSAGWVVSGLAVLLAAGVVAAESATDESAPLSDKDKADEGSRSLATMREVLGRVNKLVEEARQERDALRLNCVNERKTQISGLVKVAEMSLEELRAAMRERQPEAVDHEYGKIVMARGKVESFRTEAEQCIGSLAFYDAYDKVERSFTVSSDMPISDSVMPEQVPAAVYRAPAASPSRPARSNP